MFLKKFWNNLGIKKKVFFISIFLVSITSIVLYTALYFLFPKIYINIKESNINSNLETLTKELREDSNISFTKELNSFSYENGSMVFVFSDTGELIYTTSKEFKKPPFVKENMPSNRKNERNEIMLQKRIYIKSIGKYGNIVSVTPIKVINDLQDLLITITPIIFLITVSIGVIATYIYSRIISEPILKINSIAKEIAKKNFNQKLNYSGNDEFSELSRSINTMSENLEDTILDLEVANKKLKIDIEKEKAQDRKRRDFLKAISHELKTPITIISGQIEGMIHNIGKYKDRDKYLKESLDKVNDLSLLTEEIINLSKYEEGMELKINKFNLNNLVLDILYNRGYLIHNRNLKIKFIEIKDVFINGDKDILKKVISNIITNSIRYSKENTEIEIEIGSNFFRVKNKTEEVIEVQEEKLYEAFFRVDKSRSRKGGGSGLGLYIVKTLLDLHGNINYKINIIEDEFIFYMEFL